MMRLRGEVVGLVVAGVLGEVEQFEGGDQVDDREPASFERRDAG
ncbi:hypothetical protein [Pseudonocardia sp. TRM90224]|nr:hypothetical protein [Pseudonocardia sp. TRM90224]